MSETVNVKLGARSYPIVIGAGLLDQARLQLAEHIGQNRVFIITDEHVAAHHLPALAAQFPEADPIILPAGEGTKSWSSLSGLCDELLERGVERQDVLIAFGGGVIGDLVGFAASILKRGCGFIQVPTTLLSQVDSSVGGKTAINVSAGKNLIGAFYQPLAVLIDPLVLSTLSPRDLRSGYAEVVKYGLINDPAFFDWCEANVDRVLSGDLEAQTYAIVKSVTSKAKIVADDERETKNVRALLNLGHTFGHALEAETGFSDALTHGEAVAAGMALAHDYSAEIGLCAAQDAARVKKHLDQASLPSSLSKAAISASGSKLVNHMRHDKKMNGGQLPFILSRGIGQAQVESSVDLESVAQFLDRNQAVYS